MSEEKVKEAKERQALAYLADYIFKNEYDTNWSSAADMSGYPIDWEQHPRLTRAQFFKDSDYPAAIRRFLEDVHSGDIESFRSMIAYIFDEKLPNDVNLKAALTTLAVIQGKSNALSTKLALTMPASLIDVDTFPDDFYRDLVHLINKAYGADVLGAAPILVRKLFENLLVDILRLYYGMRDVKVFFDKEHGKFQDFGILIDNARAKVGDFDWCNDLMNKETLTQLDKYRERGNASAHSVTMTVRKEDLDGISQEITQITKQLFKLYSLVRTAPKPQKRIRRKST
ncbi:MAG: hypothetical protein WB643_00265 [Candidatus Bathyarchaeia archaeon]